MFPSLTMAMLSIYKWPQNFQTYFLKGGPVNFGQNEIEN